MKRVEKLGNGRRGYCVRVDAGERTLRIGPNPLTKRGAEVVSKVFDCLGMDLSDTDEARTRNSAIVQDFKLRQWFQNDIHVY